MLNLKNKEACVGCFACYNICPKHCITMAEDEEGFPYPVIQKDLCIQCGLCEKVCQAVNPAIKSEKFSLIPDAYACYNKNSGICENSSSGGVFAALATAVIQSGGVVFGAALGTDCEVYHICVDNIEDIGKIQKSKYVQSAIEDTFCDAKNFLDQGRTVLFTGTPCQIEGLLRYLRKPYGNLYTQDLICHGVPSPLIWRKYVKLREEKAHSRVSSVSFRDKTSGWSKFSLKFSFKNTEQHREKLTKDLFLQGFLNNLYLRPSCYQCNLKTVNRRSDITLADFWGIKKIAPKMFNPMGTSLVLIHTAKGKKLFDDIKDELVLQKVDIDAAISYNGAACNSVAKPQEREKVIQDIIKHGFESKTYKKTLAKKKDNLLIYYSKAVIRRLKHFIVKK